MSNVLSSSSATYQGDASGYGRGHSPLRESILSSNSVSYPRSLKPQNLRHKSDADQLREKQIDERRQLRSIDEMQEESGAPRSRENSSKELGRRSL